MNSQVLDRELGVVREAIAYGRIYPEVSVDEIRLHLTSRYHFQNPMPLDEVATDVEDMMRKWQVQVTHPRYFGLFNPNVALAAVLAETLVAMYNPQLANWRTSPAANEIERHTLGWLAAKLNLPTESFAIFTSGGSEANLTAIIGALTRAFPEYGECGIRSLDKAPVIYLSAEAHNGYAKLAHIVGIGRRALRTVPTDARLRMDIDALRELIAEDRGNGYAPFMVVGTAGATGTGVIDPLLEIAEVCRDSGLWFHVDAAWGGTAILSPKLKHCLAGIEHADSVTWDAHKWLSVPMGSGMFFCRDRANMTQAFRTSITYMQGEQQGPVFDPLTHSIQWSRRFIGLKLFMMLAERGEQGYAEMIERQAALGDELRNLLASSGWLILNDTPLPLVCFTRAGLDVPRFLDCVRERQIAWLSPVRVGETIAVRACITNFSTTENDVRYVVDAMNQIACQHSLV